MAFTDTSQVSSMPLPPLAYIEMYSNENLSKGNAPKPPVIQNEYEMFGETCNTEAGIIKSLEDYNVLRLYPEKYNRKSVLKKLNISLIANFMDLLNIMIKCPESEFEVPAASKEEGEENVTFKKLRMTEKVDDIAVLFFNMYHIINEMRIHQARETLRFMIITQLKKRCDVIKLMLKAIQEAEDLITEACNAIPEITDLTADLSLDKYTKEDEKPSLSCLTDSAEDSGVDPKDKIMCQIVDDHLSSNSLDS